MVKAYFAGTLAGHMAGLSKAGQLRAGYAAATTAAAGVHAVSRVPVYANPINALNLLPKPDFSQAAAVERESNRQRHLAFLGLGSLQSRPGEHTSRGGTPETGKSIPGASAPKGRSRLSSKKPRGMISRANRRGAPISGKRRPRTVRYRKGGCPPGYRYDRRRRMCVLTN